MRTLVTTLLGGLLLTACGPQAGNSERNASAGTNAATSHGGMPATIDPGSPDRSFAELMIPHHRGAIQMAEAELRLGKDPELRTLATKIIADQQREIAQLERWLARSNVPAAKQ